MVDHNQTDIDHLAILNEGILVRALVKSHRQLKGLPLIPGSCHLDIMIILFHADGDEDQEYDLKRHDDNDDNYRFIA